MYILLILTRENEYAKVDVERGYDVVANAGDCDRSGCDLEVRASCTTMIGAELLLFNRDCLENIQERTVARGKAVYVPPGQTGN